MKDVRIGIMKSFELEFNCNWIILIGSSNEAKKYTSTERERLIEASLQRINDRILRARDIM